VFVEEEAEEEASAEHVSETSPEQLQPEKPQSAVGSERAVSARSGATADVAKDMHATGLSFLTLSWIVLCGIFIHMITSTTLSEPAEMVFMLLYYSSCHKIFSSSD